MSGEVLSGEVKWAVMVRYVRNYWDAVVFNTKEEAEQEYLRIKNLRSYKSVVLCTVTGDTDEKR